MGRDGTSTRYKASDPKDKERCQLPGIRIEPRRITLQPQLAEAYNNRGIIARTLGDYRQASKDFERAAQLGIFLV